MANIKVEDLAKELNRSNKEVIDYLQGKGVEVKSHVSPVSDDIADSVKKELGKNAEAPKKKNIIRVFRSQNASGKIPERRPRKQDGARRPEGRRQDAAKTAKTDAPTKPVKTAETQAVKPEVVKPAATPAKSEVVKPAAAPAETVKEPAKAQEPVKAETAKQENRQDNSAQKNTNAQVEKSMMGTDRGMEKEKSFNQNRGGQNRSDNRKKDFNQNRGGQNREEGKSRNFNQNREEGKGRNAGQNRGEGQGRGFNQNREEGRGRNFGQNRGEGQGRGFNQNREEFDKNRNEGGRPQGNRSFGQNRPSRPAMEVPDAPLVKKPSRDPRKDNKEREKNREQLKENNGKRPNQSNRPNQKKDQFKRVPKALEKPTPKQKQEVKQEVVTEITIPEKLTIHELADAMKMQPSVIIKKLFMEGMIVTMNHEIDFEKAAEIAMDFDIIAEQEEKVDVIEELLKEEEESEDLMVTRPPVVCVMGHVDHGKTSLLDAIRHTQVTSREAGGITQHIGAYTVDVDGQQITFLDTPGHEAFTAMRMRGANSTDIAILVVAADDGVMPQTIEAINHAKAAGVEIIVAINKIDKPSANVDRVKQELTEYGLIAEDWGGSTVFAPVSAHTKEGIDNLLEMILLTAEMCELKANPNRKARGLVIEAQLDKGKGPVATILVQKGTLRQGDFIACGACSGKVRAMMDDKGLRVKEAGPSTPVEILGLSDVPNAGEVLVATNSDKEAKEFAATFISENRNKMLEDTKQRMSLDDLFTQIKEGNLKELPLIVKADVQGSVEAVKQSLLKLSNEEVVVKVIHSGVGAINESDVSLASASNAIIVGFNIRPDATAKAIAEQEGVDVRLYRVIYQAIEEIEAAMKGMLDAIYEPKTIGHAIIRQIFKASGVGNIAGSYVTDGEFQRNCLIRISREGEQIYEGKLASLKRFKDDVKEVKAGYECGLVFEDFNDVREDDIVEAYIMVEVPR